MFLVDTNVFLEVLLEQKNHLEAEKFLQSVPSEFLHVSDFSLYSVGIILTKLKKPEVFRIFSADLMDSGVTLLRLSPIEFDALVRAIQEFSIDFDDAYQYTLAKRYRLKIVSFDSDFDKTDIGRITPLQALNVFEKLQSRR